MEPRGQVLIPIYLESSALVRLLVEADRPLARAAAGAPKRLASALSFLEADRALTRASLQKRLTRAQLADAAHALIAIRSVTELRAIDGEVMEQARRVFPIETVRSLDAIHLATALVLRESVGSIAFASTDERVRENARALGFELVP